ncbi:hypothetical protein [Brassicibacter mesophilus]|uniref:hypothetical protein n=1 Tax=Brassicibacter mesophilus TaxID=745119 RepID=UPI003D23765C
MIRVNKNWGEFALVRKIGINLEDNNVYSIAEFFVVKKYRKLGVGKGVAKMIFDRFKGEWKVGQIENNALAQYFWRSQRTRMGWTNSEINNIYKI